MSDNKQIPQQKPPQYNPPPRLDVITRSIDRTNDNKNERFIKR